MMNSQPQYKPVYYLQRPNSPKNITNQSFSTKNLSLTMSIGANQSSSNFIPNFRTRQELPAHQPSPIQTPPLDNDMRLLIRENSTLKQQNQTLKRQLLRIRRQGPEAFRSLQKNSVPSSQSLSDLRGTIKRQTGQVKQLRMRLETVSNQIKLYEQIIQKMDERLKKLTHDNTRKGVQIDNLSSQMAKLQELKDKVNQTMQAYSDLQNKYHDHMLEWARWRQNWLQEKQAYQERIRQLERSRITPH